MADSPSPETSRSRQRERTRGRILAAASELFAENGYDRTSIRAVAAGASVDPKLVLHYFTSKDELFRSVLRTSTTPRATGGAPGATEGESDSCLAEEFLRELTTTLGDDRSGMIAMIRSMLTNEDAAQAIRHSTAVLQDALGHRIDGPDADTRVSLIGALLLGVVIGHDLLELPGLRGAGAEHLVGLLRPCVHLLTHGVPEHHGCLPATGTQVAGNERRSPE